MADDAEDIGGMSVSVGASHAALPGDLAEADRILEAWAKQRFTVQIGATVQAPQQAAPRQAVQQPPRVVYGAGASTQAQAQNSQTALQRAINAELAKTGEIYDAQTGEIESATKAYRTQKTVIAEVHEEAAKPTELNLDTKSLQNDLQAILATMREIAAEAQKVSLAGPPASSGGPQGGGGRVRGPVSTPQLDTDAQTRGNRQFQTLAQSSSTVFVPSRDAGGSRGGGGGGGGLPPPPAGGGGDSGRRRQQEAEAYDQAHRQQTLDAFRQSERIRQRSIDEEALVRGQARREAAITGSGRTQRTLFSGVAALFGGTERRQIEAQLFSQQAQRQLQAAREAFRPLDILVKSYDHDLHSVSASTRANAQEQVKAIKNSDTYKGALQGLKKALVEDADATERLQKISGPASIARNLTAITTAGLAFGAALKIVDVALGAMAPALGDAIDRASGFGATSNKVTQALAQQTLAAHGNVNAVLATAEAQAGLSTSAANAVNDQIKLTTQIKAGAQAAGQAGGLFRAGIGANQQAPQGLLGGYGGLFGGPAFAQQLGGGAGLAETIKSVFGDFTTASRQATGQARGDVLGQAFGKPGIPSIQDLLNQPTGIQLFKGITRPVPQGQEQATRLLQISKERTAAEDSFNQAAKRGAVALGLTSDAVVHFAVITDAQATALQSTNLPQELKDTAKQSNEALIDASGNLVTTYKKAIEGLEQVGVGQGIPDQATFGRIALAQEQQRQREAQASIPAIQAQQAYERPSQIAAVARQTGYQINTQLPAQAALAALANPNVPVGTGIARQDQGKVVGQLKQAQAEQQQLNSFYAQGQSIIENTYRPAIIQNFGQAAVQQFDAALSAVKQTGQAIASIQAGISNEQAAYQVAQYNFQLLIAKRNLSDIGGLIGQNLGAGESELGVLERQNLQLSRQGQQLQFALSQRQINFQQALAGFQAPGITPEERQARIAEAKIEADFAQKQLNINKQQFQNQVKIVDIGNLRQGADLVRQIGLLTQGRKVTIDTAGAEQRLLRLQQLQQQNVARVTGYLNAVDNLASQAFGQIQQLEAAAGKAMSSVAVDVLKQFGIVIKGLTSDLSGFTTQGNTGATHNTNRKTTGASGLLGMTGGPTSMLVGEAGGEAVAILRNPRIASGGHGAGTVVVNFNGDIHTESAASLDKVTQAVVKALGKQASIVGLRGIG